MKSASNFREKHHQNHFLKKDSFHCLANSAPLFSYIICLTIAIVIGFHLLFHPRNIKYTANIQRYNRTNAFIQPEKGGPAICSGGNGFETRQGLYIPTTAARHFRSQKTVSCMGGRIEIFFIGDGNLTNVNYLVSARIPESFLSTLRDKKMAFIGDSLARNQMESLLCHLSMAETPKSIENNTKYKSATWDFPKHNFTLMVLWSQFLVTATERLVNGIATGGFHLQLDKVNGNWLEKLPSIDFAVFSDGHWFSRPNYLYEGGNFIGCVYCNEPNVTDLGPGLAVRKAFRTAFKAINDCKNCKKIFTLLRTYSPPHFENGAWNAGGGCNRTWPIGREEVNKAAQDWGYMKVQIEEIEIARNAGKENGNKFEVLDVTEMMMMRPDGHPGVHWGNQWMKGYSDCIHWCMPGPIDTWNELLLELIKRRITSSSETDAGS